MKKTKYGVIKIDGHTDQKIIDELMEITKDSINMMDGSVTVDKLSDKARDKLLAALKKHNLIPSGARFVAESENRKAAISVVTDIIRNLSVFHDERNLRGFINSRDKDKALDLYNACAHYIRTYNTITLLDDSNDGQ